MIQNKLKTPHPIPCPSCGETAFHQVIVGIYGKSISIDQFQFSQDTENDLTTPPSCDFCGAFISAGRIMHHGIMAIALDDDVIYRNRGEDIPAPELV